MLLYAGGQVVIKALQAGVVAFGPGPDVAAPHRVDLVKPERAAVA